MRHPTDRRSLRHVVPIVVALVALASLSGTAFAADDGLTLDPSRSFGAKTYSSWKANEGLPDSTGTADQALYFQKRVPTAHPSVALAFVRGVAGKPASFLTGLQSRLEWERRNDGQCAPGRLENGTRPVPAWQLSLRSAATGDFYRVVLDCQESMDTPGTNPLEWTRETHTGAFIQSEIVEEGGNPSTDTIVALVIGFDRGSDTPSPYVFLDNISVNSTTWTSAADNGGGSS